MSAPNKSSALPATGRFCRLYAVFLILGIHLIIAVFIFFFANAENSNPSVLNSQNEIIFAANYAYSNVLGQNLVKFKISNYHNYYTVDQNFPDLSGFKNTHLDISQAHSVILMIAVTEFETKENLKSFLDKITPSTRLFWLSMPPVDNRKTSQPLNTEIIEFNQKIKELCAAKVNCSFIDLNHLMADKDGNLKASLHIGDGIHLNQSGFQVIENALNSVIP